MKVTLGQVINSILKKCDLEEVPANTVSDMLQEAHKRMAAKPADAFSERAFDLTTKRRQLHEIKTFNNALNSYRDEDLAAPAEALA